jgi:hypothetical protein
MKPLLKQFRHLALAFVAATSLISVQVSANGDIGDHVNDLQGHIKQYTQEVSWLIAKLDEIVVRYDTKGAKAAQSDKLMENWEVVDFHSAIETQYVPVYASIWQGIFGVKQAIDGEQPIAKVREQQALLEQSLWQALGAVKLAAQYQKQGLLAKVKTTEKGNLTQPQTIDEIKHHLDRVVAKYAERLPESAVSIVHDTYLHLFEGVEGALIAQDANLVEDLEKDFNVTLPKALASNSSVDDIRNVVEDMQAKLDSARVLLVQAEKKQKDVF